MRNIGSFIYRVLVNKKDIFDFFDQLFVNAMKKIYSLYIISDSCLRCSAARSRNSGTVSLQQYGLKLYQWGMAGWEL